jgi:hypothetical protein
MPEGQLVGRDVGAVQEAYAVNIVMHRGLHGVSINPPHGIVLHAGDTLLVIAPMPCLVKLEACNQGKQ